MTSAEDSKNAQSPSTSSHIKSSPNSFAHGEDTSRLRSNSSPAHPCAASEARQHVDVDQTADSNSRPSDTRSATRPCESADQPEAVTDADPGTSSRIAESQSMDEKDSCLQCSVVHCSACLCIAGARHSSMAEDAVRIFSRFIAKEATQPIKVSDELRTRVISECAWQPSVDKV